MPEPKKTTPELERLYACMNALVAETDAVNHAMQACIHAYANLTIKKDLPSAELVRERAHIALDAVFDNLAGTASTSHAVNDEIRKIENGNVT